MICNQLTLRTFIAKPPDRSPASHSVSTLPQLFTEHLTPSSSSATPSTPSGQKACLRRSRDEAAEEQSTTTRRRRTTSRRTASPHTVRPAPKAAKRRVREMEVGSVLEAVVLPQIRRHVVQTMLAARERLEADGEYYRPFQLYGYDFCSTTSSRCGCARSTSPRWRTSCYLRS